MHHHLSKSNHGMTSVMSQRAALSHWILNTLSKLFVATNPKANIFCKEAANTRLTSLFFFLLKTFNKRKKVDINESKVKKQLIKNRTPRSTLCMCN